MNIVREITYQPSVQGTTVVNSTVTGGTVDLTPSYEPYFSTVVAFGSNVAGGTATVYTHQSNDGSTWGTLGSIVAPAGTLSQGSVYSGTYVATQRYVRAHVAAVGAGGTIVAAALLGLKKRVVD